MSQEPDDFDPGPPTKVDYLIVYMLGAAMVAFVLVAFVKLVAWWLT